MTLTYDTSIEVTEKQYVFLMSEFEGVVAGMQKDGKFYIKVWLTRYSKQINKILQNPKSL